MDYIGLLSKFKINRPLTEEERAYQLRQDRKLKIEPLYQLSVIRMNSTYLEMVDKFYAWKGLATLFSAVVSGMLAAFLIAMVVWMTSLGWHTVYAQRHDEALFLLFGFFILFSPLLTAFLWMLRKEAFRYTHYPIRLNRKTRMVHVFRLDGTILSVPWNEVFFTLGQTQTKGGRYIAGHILDPDGITVRETFGLSYYGGMDAAELDPNNPIVGERDYVRRYWEFVRRYMEEGPAGLVDKIEFVMPIAEKRESIGHSFSRFNANWGPLWLLFLPITLLVWPFRVLAMRTCKIPRWPLEVENACEVEAEDRYRRDEQHLHPNATSVMVST